MASQDIVSSRADQDQQLRVVIVGHVDHGKSTLIGRLLYDTGSLPEAKLDEIRAMCDKRGTHALEWSYLLDAFQAERDQAVTIDTTQIRFATDKRDYVIIDAPGHEQFLKNMVSGAAEADAAILVVDAKEGVQDQTKRHAYLLQLLGMRQVAVMVNKMDTVEHDSQRFEKVSRDVEHYLSSLGLKAMHIVPIAARAGEMIAAHSEAMPWYTGRVMVEVLDCLEPAEPPIEKPLRFPVQDVYRMGEERIIVGRVESGAIREGDEIHISPTEEVATVTAIDVWPDDPAKVKARAGEVIGIRLDRPVFVERGHIISHNDSLPMLSNVFQANIVWLGRNPLKIGNAYKVRFATTEAAVTVQSIERVINTDSLGHDEHAGTVPRNSVAQVTLRARELLALDSHTDNDRLGRLVIYDGYDIAGGGRIETEGFPDQRRRNIPKSQNLYEVSHLLNREARARQKGHHGGVIWFTGLSGAGKSTIAMAAEKALFERGYHTYVLDGDNVRHGLNADLGFSPEDRAENIRRVGEVAALMADAGQVVITSFISPYRADRGNARAAAPEHFHEIYVRADLDTCETRDPKGLYKRAREGEIADFTGIDAPYEVPDNPELVVDTQHNDLDTCVEQVVTYIAQMLDLEQESSAAANQQRAGKEQIIA